MQSRVFVRSSPQVCRIVKAVPQAQRTMSLFSAAPVIARSFPTSPFASFEREIAPFFRLMEDVTSSLGHIVPNAAQRATVTVPYQPRFDVREVEGAYELRGELPGVESSNLEVEFSDAQTLIIRGRTESETTSGTPQAEVQQSSTAAVEDAEPITTQAVADDAASTHSTTSYQRATVEDENATEETATTPGRTTPAESAVSEAQPSQVKASTNGNVNTPHYWVSERRTGSFQRVFNFPTKIDQEAVKASLKNGILSVVVPKAVAKAPRRIAVQ